jgi:rhodanese-related sulfurtransferase
MKKQIYLLLSLSAIFFTATAQNTYNEITLPELMKKKKQDDKNMVIVDVRSKGEYGDTSRNKQVNIGHIKGAINIVLGDLQRDPNTIKQLEAYKDKDIYLVCSHSYRSRSASNILLKNGFTHVNNVQGGMTEWYRRYDELSPYRNEFLEQGIIYKNISPSQLLNELMEGQNVLLIGIRCPVKYWYDSLNIKLYQHLPLFKNAVYFNDNDSLKVWEEVQKDKNRPVVLFNMVNSGAPEIAEWLINKGISNVSFLVGGNSLFYEYTANKQIPGKTDKFLTTQSNVHFITPVIYCKMMNDKNVQMIDVRHDTIFNKVNSGTKHDFKHLKGAVNFFAGKEISLFEKEFADKKKEFVFISNNMDGLALADALTKKGYKISWMLGGVDRWEWYMNNTEDFKCNDSLVE